VPILLDYQRKVWARHTAGISNRVMTIDPYEMRKRKTFYADELGHHDIEH
jgi:hypothetical protein